MKLATVVGPKQLEFADSGDGIFMCLAQFAAVDSEYRSYYREKAAQGNEVILDNGAAEGKAMDLEDLLLLIYDIKPTVWVIPDAVNDMGATLESLATAWTTHILPTPYMVVPQGSTSHHWHMCLAAMKWCTLETGWVGISKFVDKFKPRRWLLDEIQPRSTSLYHLLGLNDPRELSKQVEDHPWIHSCDTSLPIAYGMNGHSLADFEDHGKFDMNFKRAVPVMRKRLTWDNIEHLKEMAHGKFPGR